MTYEHNLGGILSTAASRVGISMAHLTQGGGHQNWKRHLFERHPRSQPTFRSPAGIVPIRLKTNGHYFAPLTTQYHRNTTNSRRVSQPVGSCPSTALTTLFRVTRVGRKCSLRRSWQMVACTCRLGNGDGIPGNGDMDSGAIKQPQSPEKE